MGPAMEMPETYAGAGRQPTTPWATWGTQVPPLLSKTRSQFQAFFKGMNADAGTASQNMFGALQKGFDGIADQLATLAVTGRANFRALFAGIAEELIRSNLQSLFAKIGGAASSGGGGFLASLAGMFAGARAAGGPVAPGAAYIVGERQPEVFVPDRPGTHHQPAFHG